MTSRSDLRHDIEEHRHELAETVDALAAKLDVRSRLKERAASLRPMAKPAAAVAVVLVVLKVVKHRRRS